MAIKLATLLLLLRLLATVSAADNKHDWPTDHLLGADESVSAATTLAVFEKGKFGTSSFELKTSDSSSPPRPLLVVAPNVSGEYPVLLFFHGTALRNVFYSDLLSLVASHGYIIVAPQLCDVSIFTNICGIPLPSAVDEIEYAAKVANWLISDLSSVLHKNVKTATIEANLQKISLAGHSRGGKTAFALALGRTEVALIPNISGLIGVDPVAGNKKNKELEEPYILTHIPHSFNLSIPVSVIGTGLGNQSAIPIIWPVCAPDGVSHQEFFNECKAPSSHFVVTKYGHMDMLDDYVPGGLLCKSGSGPKKTMRSTVSGIIVAYLNAYFADDNGDYDTILENPGVAPTKVDPVQFFWSTKSANCSSLRSCPL